MLYLAKVRREDWDLSQKLRAWLDCLVVGVEGRQRRLTMSMLYWALCLSAHVNFSEHIKAEFLSLASKSGSCDLTNPIPCWSPSFH